MNSEIVLQFLVVTVSAVVVCLDVAKVSDARWVGLAASIMVFLVCLCSFLRALFRNL